MRFVKLGTTAYGGPAMIGQIRQMVVNDCGWMEEEDFLQGLAFVQTIPGGTVPQMVAYAGYRLRGISGALASMVAYLLPPFFTLVVLSIIYFRTRTLWFTGPIFKGLSAMVVAIVLDACLTLGRPILRDWQAILISVLSFTGLFLRLNILVILVSAGMAALLLYRKERIKAGPGRFDAPVPKLRKEDIQMLALVAALICSAFAVSYFVDPQLTYLSLSLAKIGTLMFGGGFTVIPLIQYEVVEKFQWIGTKEFLDGIALGQLTPGPMMITAFIGNAHSGFLGAVVATVALMSPSFFMLVLLLPYHDWLRKVEAVRIVERGILASFVGMLGLVLYDFGKTALTGTLPILFAGAAFFALTKKINLLYIILCGAILSLFLFGSGI
jgi:chromate transporter